MDNLILQYTLENALKYSGKANIGSVIGQLLQNDPKLKANVKELSQKVQETVKHVNSLSIEQQQKEFDNFNEKPRKEKKKRQSRTIPRLKNAKGKVIMRFAPNPNGSLSLGHCRQALWNYFFVEKNKGSYLLRYDDTDPKVKVPLKEAYNWIKEDLQWLNVKVNKTAIQSKRLSTYYKYAEKLVKQNNAYVCTCNPEKFRKLIQKSIICPCRELSSLEQLKRWKSMFKKYKEGEAVLRIKTNIMHSNPAVRDWPAFRIVKKSKHPLNKTNKVWPLLNFASAIDDHDFKVTHILRGTDLEISDRRQKYIYDYFNWQYPETMYSGKLLYEGVKSTTQIKQLIDENKLLGWDDPRLGTIRALRRRGIQKETIINFIKDSGIGKSDIHVALENLYALNKSFIDKTSNRYFAVIDPIKLTIENSPEKEVKINFHPDYPKNGSRSFNVNKNFYIQKQDFTSLKKDKLYRLMDCLNFTFNNTEYTYNSEDHETYEKQGEKIMHWLPQSKGLIDIEILMDNGTLVKGLAESSVKKLKVDDIIQFYRVGFVRLDKKQKNKLTFYYAHR
ncbi:glutamate--tRNA ligase [archaeon]|nr:glutamate--tRNA ligase [archaeon]